MADDIKKKTEETDCRESDEISQQKITGPSLSKTTIAVCCTILLSAILTDSIKRYCSIDDHITRNDKPKYWVYSAFNDVENLNGLLKHVHLVLRRVNYEKSTNKTDWNLLWSHDYPFRSLFPHMSRLKEHQKVNHFPGTGFITHKASLASSGLEFIPKAFKLPQEKAKFLEYKEQNPDSMFLEKDNEHRGVILKNVSDIDLDSRFNFVQEYVQRPFLVDGYKFDIGVYVVLTSVDPLRVYWYKGDILFRYCPEKYYPLNPKNLNQYVIGDDYKPTWEIPSLKHPYVNLGFGMKDSFDDYLRSKKKDPDLVTERLIEAIRSVFIRKEHHVIEALKYYPSQNNFFELMRFDLMLDEDLNVHLLEANMSPNLSSAHFPPNQLLYEQLLYNLFAITGVSSYLSRSLNESEFQSARAMMTSQKNIAVWSRECTTLCRSSCEEFHPVCSVCRHCLDSKMKDSLMRAHYEHLHRGDFKRVYPEHIKPNPNSEEYFDSDLSKSNLVQKIWFQGKCNIDTTWC